MRIPDLTERFPEGMDGVDMCEPRDPEYEFWQTVDKAEQYEREEMYAEEEEPEKRMVRYRVKIDDIHFKTNVWYDATDEHSEEDAIEWVLGNMYDEIKEHIKKAIYVDEID